MKKNYLYYMASLFASDWGKKKNIDYHKLEPFGSFSIEAGGVYSKSSLVFENGYSVNKTDWHIISKIHFAPLEKLSRVDKYQQGAMLLGAVDSVRLVEHLEQVSEEETDSSLGILLHRLQGE